MNDDDLTLLLARADTPAPPPRLNDGSLAEAVRSRAARRSVARRVTALSVAALLCLSVALFTHRPSPPTVTPSVNVAQLRAEMALLDSQARVHELTARTVERSMTAARRTTAAERMLAAASVDDVQEHRESAAAILVYQAGKLALEPATKNAARHELQSAAELFPDTVAGREAEASLNHGT